MCRIGWEWGCGGVSRSWKRRNCAVVLQDFWEVGLTASRVSTLLSPGQDLIGLTNLTDKQLLDARCPKLNRNEAAQEDQSSDEDLLVAKAFCETGI